MIFTVLFLLAFGHSLQYKKGETFSYVYTSHVDNVASQEGKENRKMQFEMSCTAKFRVVGVVADGANMEMVLSDVSNKVGSDEKMEDAQKDETTEMAYSNPIYFKLLNDGSITDVCGNNEDSSDLINIKINVAYTLRTNLMNNANSYTRKAVIDPLGQHYEYVQTTTQGNTMKIATQYSENDFVAFSDRNMNEGIVSVDVDSTHEVTSEKITHARGNMVVVFNKAASGRNAETSDIKILGIGKYVLDSFAQGNDVLIETNLVYSNVYQFLKNNKNYRRVPTLSEAFYARNFVSLQNEVNKLGEATCPGNIDLCKAVEYTWTTGDQNFGLYFRAAALAGVTTGCTEAHRSYMAGAYLQFDILLLQQAVHAVDIYAEYGQVEGVPQRNAISFSMFGNNYFYQEIPYLNCIQNTIPIAAYNHTWRLPYTTQVYFVTLSFFVEAYVSLSADVTYTVCVMEFKASISFIPRAAVKLSGGAEASVYIGKAGIEISGSIADHLDPTAYLDGNLCRIGFKASNVVEPFQAQLAGYYQLLKLVFKDWKIYFEMGPKHTYPFWSYYWPGRTDQICDIWWGAK